MESVGKYLREERETRNLSLNEIAESTRIRKHLLMAIEEDRYDLLPHPLYVKGYLGAYARRLGFDPNEVLLRYQEQVKSLTPALPPPEAETQGLRSYTRGWKTGGRPLPFFPGWIAAGLLCLAVAVYGLREIPFWTFSHSGKESILVQGKAEAQRAVEAIQKEISMVGETEAKGVLPQEESPYEVLEANIGKGIELEGGRSIFKEKCSEFPCDSQRAYFFTRVRAGRDGKVTHLWYRDGKEFHRAELEVKPPAWTVYSYLTLRPGQAGNWMAELRDGNTILSSQSFSVVEAEKF